MILSIPMTCERYSGVQKIKNTAITEFVFVLVRSFGVGYMSTARVLVKKDRPEVAFISIRTA